MEGRGQRMLPTLRRSGELGEDEEGRGKMVTTSLKETLLTPLEALERRMEEGGDLRRRTIVQLALLRGPLHKILMPNRTTIMLEMEVDVEVVRDDPTEATDLKANLLRKN
ncbi:hypothetical protein GUJ93_ZPchr1136g16427 [Zizania palustris]|uniref:Uncharacterized protein n=1 Tax=Zizania palustris TaxID=103762 RepID=A0A8J5T7D4_ZIZPA|nr:hypothetical protein GUJ93_ZPchr1136g16427 [Zizania palustris]